MKKQLYFILLVLVAMSCVSEKDYLVTIKTDYGNMHAILYDQTPEHKANFIKLAKDGYYDSMLFHRVIEDFMIQGGDPNSKNAQPGVPLGSGGPGYRIPAEFDENLFHQKGALSAARTNNPEKESSGSQFYIVQGKTYTENELKIDQEKLNKGIGMLVQRTDYDSIKKELVGLYEAQDFEAYQKRIIELAPVVEEVMQMDVHKVTSPDKIEAYTTVGGAPHLDDEYTVFGQVIDGMDIIDKIATQPTDRRDRPKEDIRFFISVEELPKKKIEKEYNFTFPELEETGEE